MNGGLKISVVVPLFNKETEVTRALRSALHQTHAPAEIIVVNDGSTDSSASVVGSLGDNRIRMIHQANAGVSAARNVGIHAASNSHIAFLDADDEWLPHFLEEILLIIKQFPEAGIYATKYLYCETQGTMREPILRGFQPPAGKVMYDDYFRVAASSDPPVWSSAVCAAKEALVSIGGFPEGIGIGEDLVTWARIAARYRIAYSTKPSAVFHLQAPLVGKPSRKPEVPDRVAAELRTLLPLFDGKKRRSFCRYCATWHRMRAAMYTQLGNRGDALKELFRSARCDWREPRLYLNCGLLLLPAGLRKEIINRISSTKIAQRKRPHDE